METGKNSLEPLDLTETQEYTHHAHRFPGKFHPPLIANILREYSNHDIIADPMCGSGTVGLEAAVSGKDAMCVDIDPLSALMTKAKVNPVEPQRLLNFRDEIINRAGAMPNEGDFNEKSARAEVEANIDDTPFGTPINLFHWFEPYVAVGFTRLLGSAGTVLKDVSPAMDDAIRTSLAAMVRQISRADPDPVSGLEVTKIRKQELEEGIDFDVVQSFQNVSNRLADGYEQLLEIEDLGTVEVIQANANCFATLCHQTGIKPTMVLTSPPYCNAIEYTRRHRLECEWLGLFNGDAVDNPRDERIETSREFFGSTTLLKDTLQDLPTVEHEEVRETTAKIEAMGNERKANLLRKYFLDAYDWIEEIHKVLPQDGLFCMIVGPSTSYGHTINTPKYLTDIAEKTGFEVESTQSYKLVNNKMQYPTEGETTDRESLIKLRVV